MRLPPPDFSAARIRRYYDRNTASFVRRSQAGADGAIHRAVWGPGVTTRAEAFRFIDRRIVDLVSPVLSDHPHVVDLGCGVGASLVHMAETLPQVRGTGITISGVQAALAQTRVAAAGLSSRIQVVEGDYTALPTAVGPCHAAYAIESFVHGPSPAAFFAEASRIIRPGGLLIVCDDVLQRPLSAMTADARRTIDRFVRGWHVNSLLTRDALIAAATDAGFTHESTTDLTSWLELGRPRDRAVALLAALVGWLPVRSPLLAPLLGGHALQQGLRRGWLAFELTVFRRQARRKAPERPSLV